MKKASNVILFEDFLDRQFTVDEFVEWLPDYAKKHKITNIFMIFRENNGLYFQSASENRDYQYNQINWDIDKVKIGILQDDIIENDNEDEGI